MVDTQHNIWVNFKTDMRGFQNGINAVRKGLINSQKDLNGFAKGANKLGSQFALFGRKFQMWALSIMFFSMAIRKTFMDMAKAGIRSFTKIMESSGFFGSAIQQLAVHWEYLKFTIGSALNRVLEPLLPYIIRIVNALTTWIQKHPKLTAALISGGLALGIFLGIIAQLGLLLPAIAAMLSGPIGIVPMLLALAGISLAGIGTAILLEHLTGSQESAESLKKSFEEFIKNSKTGLKDILGTLSELATELGFKGLGGVIDVLGQGIVLMIQIALNRMNAWILKVKLLINMFKALVNFGQAMHAVFSGDFEGAKAFASKGMESLMDNSQVGQDLAMNDLALAGLVKDAVISAVSSQQDQGVMSEQIMSPIHIQNMSVETNNPEEFMSELKSMSTNI